MEIGEGDRQTHPIIGAGMEVHRELGPGFLEAVYQEAFAVELPARGVPFKREVELPIFYRGERLACTYRADFVCFGDVIVELKALSALTGIEEAQVINYLKASGLTRGLLFNFDARSLQFKRLIFSHHLRESAQSAD
jgi:GxxExxY protein